MKKENFKIVKSNISKHSKTKDDYSESKFQNLASYKMTKKFIGKFPIKLIPRPPSDLQKYKSLIGALRKKSKPRLVFSFSEED